MTTALFLALVRSGLYERPLAADELSLARSATDADWAKMLKAATQQTVLGQLYQAIFLLPPDVRPPEAIVTELMSRALRGVRRSFAVKAATESLTDRLKQIGLSPVVMKGVTIAAYYPHPEFRAAGDIDLYLPCGQLERAAEILDDKAVSPDGSFTGRFGGIDVDLHEHYFDLHIPASRLPDIRTPEATLLMLSSHILKHTIGTGVGLRQLCDMAMACKALDGAFDTANLREIFLRTGTLRWNRLLFSFLSDHLDLLDPVFGSEHVSSAPLLRIVLEGGNFGHFAAARAEELAVGGRRRKLDTFRRFVYRLPFSLRYAPRETFATIWSLTRGNL